MGKNPVAAAPGIKSLDFSAGTPCRVLGINLSQPGDAGTAFVDFTLETNRKLIFEAWKDTPFSKNTPDEVLNQVAALPETFKTANEEDTF